MPRLTTEQRFWAKVHKTDICWLWTASTSRNGYGRFKVAVGQRWMAHRYAYALLVGPIPDGMQLDHLCRNRLCVNPDHMEPVTPRENQRRGYGQSGLNFRKTHCVHGHALSGENLRVTNAGRRSCRACARERWRAMHGRPQGGDDG